MTARGMMELWSLCGGIFCGSVGHDDQVRDVMAIEGAVELRSIRDGISRMIWIGYCQNVSLFTSSRSDSCDLVSDITVLAVALRPLSHLLPAAFDATLLVTSVARSLPKWHTGRVPPGHDAHARVVSVDAPIDHALLER